MTAVIAQIFLLPLFDIAEAEVDLTDFNFDEEMEDTDAANISVGAMSNTHGGNHGTGASGFDFSTGELWIYPTNYPVRDYQYNIVQQVIIFSFRRK